jgi:hypothetical protein
VPEGGVDDGIGLGGSAPQTFKVFKITLLHLSAGGGERLCARIGACKAEHLMACANQLLDEGRNTPVSGFLDGSRIR